MFLTLSFLKLPFIIEPSTITRNRLEDIDCDPFPVGIIFRIRGKSLNSLNKGVSLGRTSGIHHTLNKSYQSYPRGLGALTSRIRGKKTSGYIRLQEGKEASLLNDFRVTQ